MGNEEGVLMQLVDVWKAYRVGDVVTWALRGVNLSIVRGDFVAIMGPSGSGKTTLLNIIGLLDRPTKGKVYVDGVDVSVLSSDELARLRNKKIGFVFQLFNLVARMTVYENIELPLIPAGVPPRLRREMVLRALKAVGGEDEWLIKKPTQLSGGQQQRVAIARALVNNPEIILADEPTGNLDRASAKVVVDTFVKLNMGGQTVVIVTHDPEVANCVNKIYIIRDGVIKDLRMPSKNECLLYKEIK